MDHGEPSPRRQASARKRAEPTPPRRSVSRTSFAECRSQVRDGHHYSDASSSESDNIPEPSGLNKKKSSEVAINLVEPSILNKKEQTGGMIDLVSEEGKKDKAKLNLGRSVSTFRPMEIKVFPPGDTTNTTNYSTMAALLESVWLDVKAAHGEGQEAVTTCQHAITQPWRQLGIANSAGKKGP